MAGADIVKQAVEETAGLVLYYDGKLVNAFYHANAGGHTENSENVWLERLLYQGCKFAFDQYAVTYPYQTSSDGQQILMNGTTYSRENLMIKLITGTTEVQIKLKLVNY